MSCTHFLAAQPWPLLASLSSVQASLPKKVSVRLHPYKCWATHGFHPPSITAGSAHLPAIAAVGPSVVTLKAIYSRSEKGAASLAADAQSKLKLSTKPDIYYDASPNATLDSLLARPDIQAVIVVLPITTQPSIIRKALSAGKHILSEKPVAPDVASGLELIRDYETSYKSKGLVWRVAENFETETAYRTAAKVIGDGKIGKVSFYNARVVNYMDTSSKWYNTPWRTVPDVSSC